jgi:DNA mismatch repair protein MSH3
MVGSSKCATLLRVALGGGCAPGGGGGGQAPGGADADAPAGRCVPWASARGCRLGASVLRDLDIFDAAAPAAAAAAGGRGAALGGAPSGLGGGSGRSLFGHLNRTRTQPGARLLRRWLCTPLREPAAIGARLSAVGLLCRAMEAEGGKEGANGRAPQLRRAPAVTPFARAGGGGAAATAGGNGGAQYAFASPPAASDLLGLTAAMAAAPCADMERALARLAAGRCAPPELWALLVTAEALLEALTAGLALPAATDADADADADACGRRLLAGLVGDVGAGGGATRAADASLLEQVRGWLRGLRREGMLAAELTAAFELDEGGAAREPLRAAARAIDAVERALRTEALPAARAALRRPTAEFKKVNHEEFLLEVPAAAARGVPTDWLRVCATKAAVRFRPPQVATLWAALQLAREDHALRAADAFAALCRDVTAATAPLRAVVHRLATLDVLAAFARVARAHGYVRPTVLRVDAAAEAAGAAQPAACLRVRGARHPTHELAMAAGCQFVPNDINLSAHALASDLGGGGGGGDGDARGDAAGGARVGARDGGGGGDDARRCALLFGPNSGGKSLYARTALTHALLAQVGCWLPCEAASLSPFDGLYTRIGSHDRVLKGESTFFVELAEAAAILREATARSLVLFDELGRGTSTHDGTAIAHATLSHVLSSVRCCTLFISHYPSLAALELERPEAVSSHHMSYVEHDDDGPGASEHAEPTDTDEGGEAAAAAAAEARGRGRAGRRVTMLFKLARGKLETSFGVNVARVAKLPDTVLRVAASRSEAFERLATQRRLLVAIQRALGGDPPADGRAPTSLEALQAEASEALARRAA